MGFCGTYSTDKNTSQKFHLIKCTSAAVKSESDGVRRSCGAWIEPVGGGLSRSSLREVEALVEQLCGLTLSGSQRTSQEDQEDQEQSDSLMQHIQVETQSDLPYKNVTLSQSVILLKLSV